ncbi:hypothetical protein [Hyalangium gracile]|uniref:hypothetical protein n=1 Tax=Hyalangium gracile TaxID=394092 RepID=UPI001CCADE74|nr:hypothetical protein [Hyalangium gracile]
MKGSLVLSVLLFLGVGCAGSGSQVRAESEGGRMGQRSAEPLLVKGAHITGPSSSLSLRQNGMRGRFRNQPLELEWDYQQVRGQFGTRPAQLELSEGDDLRASGSFGGVTVALLVKQDVLVARAGACAYYMSRVEGGFSGKRDCEGSLEEGFFIDFPESLQARPLGEMATLLTLTLVNYTDAYAQAVSPARFTAPRDFTKMEARSSSRKIN